MVRVAFADEDTAFRERVILSLRSCTDIEIVQQAGKANDLVHHFHETKPDVVLMDLQKPFTDGIETTKYLMTHFPFIKILIFTECNDESIVCSLLDNGASGYLLKSANPGEISKAISDVVTKGFYLNKFLNKILIKRNYDKQKSTPHQADDSRTREHEINEGQTEFVLRYIGNQIAFLIDRLKSVKEWIIHYFRKK